ncbi:8684e763-baad-4724-804e-1bb95811db89 [Sclerotinia trifoliorum]|uniref:8684e763-baad-4724-804e-1bb95811db89 n=1 Tax=Sclerotinia trifoliorum TaxID=28548 RepID=A0A8H2ZU50_9HELO|nr:8684e763-baad-4724-804e-1bb95811db89 [Sclerotinia trifoliorum]
MPGGVFSETLQSITTTKLKELSKKRNHFENQKEALSLKLSNELDQRKKLQLLLHGVKQSFAITTLSTNQRASDNGTKLSSIELLVKNLEKFLAQAEYDPSISDRTLKQWEQNLMRHLNVQSSKHQYATLYGELVTEWLSAEQQRQADNILNNSSETDGDFQKIKKETVARTEGRANWEKLVFEPFETDRTAIKSYLSSLFGLDGKNEQAKKALDALRKQVAAFGNDLSSLGQFNPAVLRWTINGLISSGLLSDEKRAALKDFLASPVILAEVADVLNMRLASIDTWEWNTDLAVEQRRHLNGTHHMFIDEDLLEAIFLQYIGVKWSVFFKKAFTDFSNFDGAWLKLNKPIPFIDLTKRDYYIGHQSSYPGSVQEKREKLYKSIYFMSQLPDSELDDQADEDGAEEAEHQNHHQSRSLGPTVKKLSMQPEIIPNSYNQATSNSNIAHQHSQKRRDFAQSNQNAQSFGVDTLLDDDSANSDKPPKTPMEIKQFLLHLLSTEIIINTSLHGEFTCARSEFESFSPSLPHSTIFCVFEFFGLSEKWLRFFQKFLEAPLKFTDDDISAKARIRKRGVPGAHALSAVFGETILFCLDYTVNQSTDGAQLYRMHDDFWIWSPSQQTVVEGWKSILKFSKIMGVTLNKGKTGSVRIAPSKTNKPIDPSLPTGDIRWGFLKLDPITGHFTIDQSMVDEHVSELQSQLRDKKSVFSWIQAWNTYAGRFFTSNFGKPSNSFGRAHVDAMLSSFKHIQNLIFTDTNVASYLKDTLRTRFGIDDVPDGYLYFPTSLGGLELHNPFIGLLQLRNGVYEEPEKLMSDFFGAEHESYRKAKIAFENRAPQVKMLMAQRFQVQNLDKLDPQNFMPFDEFISYREEVSGSGEVTLLKVFENLLKQPGKETAGWDEWDMVVAKAIEGGFASAFEGMDVGYWKWVIKLYGEEMRERFGGLAVVDKGLLPTGMVNLVRSGKVKWQG